MSPEMQRRTFISYSRINKDFALTLARELRTSGFDIWLDQLDIPPGARWDDEVEQALEDCEIFMVILTPASSTSDNVKDEIGYAIDTGKRILPILLENAKVPLRLRRFQYVDFTNKNYDEGIASAKNLLRKLIEEPTVPRRRASVVGHTQKAKKEGEKDDRLAVQKAEEKRMAKEKREAEQLTAKKAKADRKAKEQDERLAAQKAEDERIAQKNREAEQLAAQKAEADRMAKEEAERLAAQKAEEERIAQKNRKAEQLAAQKAEADRKAKEEAERIARQKAEKEIHEKKMLVREKIHSQTQTQTPKTDPTPVPGKLEPISAPPKMKSRLPLILGAAGIGVMAVLAVIIVAVVNMFSGEIPITGSLVENTPTEVENTPTEKAVASPTKMRPTATPRSTVTPNFAATEKAKRKAAMSAVIQEYHEAGYIPSAQGQYIELDDFDESWAQMDWYQWWQLDYSASTFVMKGHFSWSSASDTPEESGCGFVFNTPDNGGYAVFVDKDRILFLDPEGYVVGKASGSGRVSFSLPAETNFTLIVNNNDHKSYVLVDGEFVGEYHFSQDEDISGPVGYTMLSGTNKGYGTRCEITDASLWIIDK